MRERHCIRDNTCALSGCQAVIRVSARGCRDTSQFCRQKTARPAAQQPTLLSKQGLTYAGPMATCTTCPSSQLLVNCYDLINTCPQTAQGPPQQAGRRPGRCSLHACRCTWLRSAATGSRTQGPSHPPPCTQIRWVRNRQRSTIALRLHTEQRYMAGTALSWCTTRQTAGSTAAACKAACTGSLMQHSASTLVDREQAAWLSHIDQLGSADPLA